LKKIVQERSLDDADPRTVPFELAVAVLVVQTNKELEEFTKTFQRYVKSLPQTGDGWEYAELILWLLEDRIREAEKKKKRIEVLGQRVKNREKALEDLEYKLQKLEEIQQETERKREDFLHKQPIDRPADEGPVPGTGAPQED
jgi:hypothetical protein